MSTLNSNPAQPAKAGKSRSLAVRQLAKMRKLSLKLQQPLPARIRHLVNSDKDKGLEQLLRKLEQLPDFVDVNPLAPESVGRVELDNGVHSSSSDTSQDSRWKGPLSPQKVKEIFHFRPPPAATIATFSKPTGAEKTDYKRKQTAGNTSKKDGPPMADSGDLLSARPAKTRAKLTQSNAPQVQAFFPSTAKAPGQLPMGPGHQSPLKNSGQALKSLMGELARLAASADKMPVNSSHLTEPMPGTDKQRSEKNYPDHRSLKKPSSHSGPGKPSPGVAKRPIVEKRPQPAWQTLKALVLELQAIHAERRGPGSPGPSTEQAAGGHPRQQPQIAIAATVPLQIPELNTLIEPAAPPASSLMTEPLTHCEQLSQAINRALREQALLRGVELP